MMVSHAFDACDGRLVDLLRTAADGASRPWGWLGMNTTASHESISGRIHGLMSEQVRGAN